MRGFVWFSFILWSLVVMACSDQQFSAINSDPGSTAIACSNGTVATSRGCEVPVSCPTSYTVSDNLCVEPTTTSSCPSGYVYSSEYGCLPQMSCPSGQGWYIDRCVVIGGYSNICQAYCPIGFIATKFGCFPAIPACPPCTGYGGDGFCYRSINYWEFLYGAF